MKVLMIVSKDTQIVKEAILELGDALTAATLEILSGHGVGLSKCPMEDAPIGVNFEIRERRTIN